VSPSGWAKRCRTVDAHFTVTQGWIGCAVGSTPAGECFRIAAGANLDHLSTNSGRPKPLAKVGGLAYRRCVDFYGGVHDGVNITSDRAIAGWPCCRKRPGRLKNLKAGVSTMQL